MSRRSTRVDHPRAGELTALAVVLTCCVAGMWWMLHLATDPLPPCTPTSTSVCAGEPVDHTAHGGLKDSLPACPTEDSVGCFWDASGQGNGDGADVLNPLP